MAACIYRIFEDGVQYLPVPQSFTLGGGAQGGMDFGKDWLSAPLLSITNTGNGCGITRQMQGTEKCGAHTDE